ncbi:MAG TPA: RidA family protein [Planctomycetota bacterium]
MKAFLALALLPLLGACATDGGRGRCCTGIERLNTPGRADTLPFSHVVNAGGFSFIAGTLGTDPATGQAPADPEAEVRAMLDGFRAKLELAGLGMDDLVQVQVYCSDVSLYELFNRVYAGYFTAGFPSRAFIGSGPLLRGCRFEIQGIAAQR